MKLFAVYLGGKADRCNIELHDVVFVVGETIEATYPQLAKKWFGDVNRFHIDSYWELQQIEGYKITLTKEKTKSDKKLYFINLGAYKPNKFTEYHECAFYVSDDAPDAIRKAKSELCQGLTTIHKDDVIALEEFDVDDVLELGKVEDYYVSLSYTAQFDNPLPISKYIKLDFQNGGVSFGNA